jgi:molecular chaperone IbpA
MRHADFAPLFRSTIGFDRFAQMLEAANAFDSEASYPPYNIERTGDNDYRITMAVAGFHPSELKVDVKESLLSVRGEKAADEAPRTYLHRGIATRSFERRFQVADYVEVKAASLADGVLSIDLVRNLPERMQPRSVAITVDGTAPATCDKVKQLDSKAA